MDINFVTYAVQSGAIHTHATTLKINLCTGKKQTVAVVQLTFAIAIVVNAVTIVWTIFVTFAALVVIIMMVNIAVLTVAILIIAPFLPVFCIGLLKDLCFFYCSEGYFR